MFPEGFRGSGLRFAFLLFASIRVLRSRAFVIPLCAFALDFDLFGTGLPPFTPHPFARRDTRGHRCGHGVGIASRRGRKERKEIQNTKEDRGDTGYNLDDTNAVFVAPVTLL